MKRESTLHFAIFLFCTSNLFAQNTALQKGFSTDGMTVLMISTTKFRDQAYPVVSLKPGWLINKKVGAGLDFNFLAPTHTLSDITLEPVKAVGAFGGLYFEPIIYGQKLIHITFPVSLGYGFVAYLKDWNYDVDTEDHLKDVGLFKYLTPGILVEMNLIDKIRAGFGVSYRFTDKLDLRNTDSDAFKGMNYTLSLKFGDY